MVELKIRQPVVQGELPDSAEIPALAFGAMADSKPFQASAEHQKAIGFPGELVDDWKERAIEKLGELVSNSRGLRWLRSSELPTGRKRTRESCPP